jgi:hypothetical protein
VEERVRRPARAAMLGAVEQDWRVLAAQQEGLLSRAQLRACGVDRFRLRNQLAAGRWVLASSTVVATTTGDLHRRQLMWLGVLHAGPRAVVGDLTAAELAGLAHWHRDDVTVWLPDDSAVEDDLDGIRFVRTRRDLAAVRSPAGGVPRARIEPAVLHFAAYQPSARTAEGVVAAAVQQRLTTPDLLLEWVGRLRPLRRAPALRRTLAEISGGAQSVAEIDVSRMCRAARLERPARQVGRRDAAGHRRWTDCEWRLADGRTLVLEVDGAFHMDVDHWEDDLARQRAISGTGRVVVRCTARELRDEPERVAADLRRLGVPRAA